MPVILKPEDYDLWLDPKMKKPELVKPLLQPFPPDQMEGYPVSDKVNKADHEGPECVRPLDAEL
jgi:putative SOS response-associated peptidase YedK